MIIYYIICAVIGYLIGSIPFGYIIVKLVKGVDIRTVGSGNIGATNVARVLGWPLGIIVFLLDASKGAAAFFICGFVALHFHPVEYSLFPFIPLIGLAIIGGFSSICGHLFPVWFWFKGGKGMATTFGFFVVFVPLPTMISLCIWLIVVGISRYISLSSILASLGLLISLWGIYLIDIEQLSGFGFALFIFNKSLILLGTHIIVLLIIIKHIPNIKRLLNGTEPKVRLGKKVATDGK